MMNQIKLFTIALATIAMFSCSKETEDIQENNKPGEKAKLTINVVGQDVSTPSKVVGTTTAADKKINDYIAFIFREGGALDCAAKHSTSERELLFDDATTKAKKVYVIANTGALTGGIFESVTTEDGLKAVVGDLMSAANVSSHTPTNVWMSGVGDVEFGTGETANVGSAIITLEFVASKIELFVKDERIANDPTTNTAVGSISIKDDAVVLLFAGKNGKFFETTTGDQSVQTSFYTGDQSYPNPFIEHVTLSTVFNDALKTPFSKTVSTVVNYFYTFANNGTTQPTILAVKSTKTTVGVPDVKETVYYPIHFTVADAKFTIKPGTHYKVNVTLKGEVNNGGGGGTPDPEVPLTKADITVSITPSDWKTETISKEFN